MFGPTRCLVSICVLGSQSLLAGPIPELRDPIVVPVLEAVVKVRVVDINRDGQNEVIVTGCQDADGANHIAGYRIGANARIERTFIHDVSCPADLLL